MIVEELASVVDPKTGRRVTVRRQVDRPHVISPEDNRAREPERKRALDIEDLRARATQVLIDQALGINVVEQMEKLRADYKALQRE